MSDGPFRLYGDSECGDDGYPFAWHGSGQNDPNAIKNLVREEAGNRCLRCGHPYLKGMGEWSPCDDACEHGGPIRYRFGEEDWCDFGIVASRGWENKRAGLLAGAEVEARWRILTVHHLDGVKANCNWWNLVPLCQRDHLIIQRRVVMHRVWPWEHTDWFKPYVAAFYAFEYLGLNPTRAETLGALDELLDLGMERAREERMPV